jgi:hypothetical protein
MSASGFASASAGDHAKNLGSRAREIRPGKSKDVVYEVLVDQRVVRALETVTA